MGGTPRDRALTPRLRTAQRFPRHAARALHQATRTQRDQQPANPYLWASHIHAGA